MVGPRPTTLATEQRAPGPACRSCRAPLQRRLLDLGNQPLGDVLLEEEELTSAASSYPLGLAVCTACWLLQLDPSDAAPNVPDSHGHNSSYSTTTSGHERGWAEELISELGIDRHWTVVEVGSGDGNLLRHFAERGGARVLGVEAAAAAAATARAVGVPTVHAGFGLETARRLAADGWAADLVIANQFLPHVDDLDGVLAGVRALLAPGGRFSTEFVHALQMVEQGQFDLICHAHRTYLSLTALEPALTRQDLRVVNARQVPVHGGSVRVFATAGPAQEPCDGAPVQREERARGLTRVETYQGLGERAPQARAALLRLLHEAKRDGLLVAAYGAPTRGSTLLNYCGITTELVAFTVDRSPAKQGRYLPGSRLPVRSPDHIEQARPDYVLILPWTLGDEIMGQLGAVRSWGGRFVLPLPTLTVVT